MTGVSRSRWTVRLALSLGLCLSGLLAAAPASAVVCGETVESTISVLGEVDTWTFQGAAGDVMSLSIGGQHRWTSFGVQAELRDPSNKNVYFRTIYNQSGNNFYCGPHLTCETRPLPATGTYTLRIFDYQNNATGTYSFTLGAVGGTWNGASNAPPEPVCGNVTDGTRVLACGETLAGQLDVYGDDDTYVFFADAGDRVAFSISRPPDSVVNPAVELFAPDGAIVPVLAPYGDGGVSYYCEYWSCVTAAPLPLSGVYTAKVTDSGITHVGAYSFTLDSVAESFDGASNGPPAPTCGAVDDGARPIACGERVTGTIALEGDSDAYTFHADAGEGVALLVEQPAGSTVAPSAELYTPDGELVVAAGSPSVPVASGALPESGVYTIKLTDAEILDQTGAHALRIVSGRLDGAICRAGPLLRCGETVSGTLAAGEPKLFTFAALAGDAVRVHAGGAALPTVSLVGPDGAAVSPADPLPQGGVYTVGLASAAGGAYAVTLEAVSGSFNGGGNGWPPLACGGVSDGTRAISCGQTLAGSIGVAGDSDAFAFLAEAGDVVTVGVNDDVSGFAPVAELFAPGGTAVALSGGASCGPSESCVSAAVPASGAYTIRVHEPGGGATGAYSVSMNRSPCASDCQDGIDNDGDGLVDRAGDPGCATPDDLSERAECEDGFDNDGDGLVDFPDDPGCASAGASVEDPACDDGRDNDGDGQIDADGGGAGAPDAYCGGVASNTAEAAPATSGCGIGPELAVLLPLVAGARRLARRPRR